MCAERQTKSEKAKSKVRPRMGPSEGGTVQCDCLVFAIFFLEFFVLSFGGVVCLFWKQAVKDCLGVTCAALLIRPTSPEPHANTRYSLIPSYHPPGAHKVRRQQHVRRNIPPSNPRPLSQQTRTRAQRRESATPCQFRKYDTTSHALASGYTQPICVAGGTCRYTWRGNTAEAEE